MLNETEKPMFILEMANNHSGDLEHARQIIEECAKAVAPYREVFRFAFKFQHRDPTIIHPEYTQRNDIKMVKRLNDTRLTDEEFARMKDIAKENGFITMCTPFDEPSVKVVQDLGFDILKIASCSCADWPLMEAIAETDLPIIFSTGGACLEDIQAMVTFMTNRQKEFAVMHCVGAYPTPDNHLQMNQINMLQRKFPGVMIGFSTHEEPENMDAVKVAVAKGCRIFERHVGISNPDKGIGLNLYSSTPEQVGKWVAAAKKAFDMCGIDGDQRMPFTEKEICDLNDLYRGVYAKKDLEPGDIISTENCYFAMPKQEGQIISRNLSKYSQYVVTEKIPANGAVFSKSVKYTNVREEISKILKDMAVMLRDANVTPPNGASLEISAHYGLDRFRETGAILIDIINREYCKKILLMMPGQKHPNHYHKVKEETFHVLNGTLGVDLEGKIYTLKKGDVLTVPRNAKHSFWSDDGAIFEEVSTTAVKGDSYYDDEKINSNPRRKFPMIYYSKFMEL